MACIPAAISPGNSSIARGDRQNEVPKIEKRASEHLLRHADPVVLDNQPNPVAFRQQSDCNESPVGSALLVFPPSLHRIGRILNQFAKSHSRIVAVELRSAKVLDYSRNIRNLKTGIDWAPTSSLDRAGKNFR
jgi:hypothetical protein